jgi:S-adenosylmethionine:tRNA ribosyltransferase-isomerase
MVGYAAMLTADLDYALPERLIAQHPAEQRDQSRLLVVDRKTGQFEESVFAALPEHLEQGDCLALNDTRVIRARLHARKDTGGKVEIFLLHERGDGEWEALVRPSARVRPGSSVAIGKTLRASVGDVLPEGSRLVRFSRADVIDILEAEGEIPLPPYINRQGRDSADADRYQTIYAAHSGAVAAPTAGLHFTPELFAQLDDRGIRRAFLTLHVGYGTFKPIQTERVEEHRVDPEEFELPDVSAGLLNETRVSGHRVVAVGTTAVRVLETQYRDGAYRPGHGETRLCIFPPHAFRAVDAMITNFHLPRSSLLALVCAFAGKDLALHAYQYAIEHEFRFYSYGDAMLIL